MLPCGVLPCGLPRPCRRAHAGVCAPVPLVHVQVAEGSWSRHRYKVHHVQLSRNNQQVTWDDGKKSVDLSAVLRISVGLETRTLQRLYGGQNPPEDVSSHHWFSLHTAQRSFDFGAKRERAIESDENETVVLWVVTLQRLVASRLAPGASTGVCTALSNAQFQWQRFDRPHKEWMCHACTFINPPDTPQCTTCNTSRPMVTLCPVLTPLYEPLRGLANSLEVGAFEMGPEAYLLWFLVQALETPLPEPFRWAARERVAAPGVPFLIMSTDEAGHSFETLNHPHILELRRTAEGLRAQLTANGGQPDYSSQTPRFISPPSPHGSSDYGDSSDYSEMTTRRSSASGGVGTPRSGGLHTPASAGAQTPRSQAEFEADLALAAAASMEQLQLPPRDRDPAGPPSAQRGGSFEETELIEPSAVFQYCMSGSVEQLQRFLEAGGHADTVYKDDYGWEVGPDWLFTKPSNGMTLLNYVATWSAVIDQDRRGASADIARLLLRHGADLERDDRLDEWFMPLHNAVRSGAADMVDLMLQTKPEAIHLGTADARMPLHVLPLCDLAEVRRRIRPPPHTPADHGRARARARRRAGIGCAGIGRAGIGRAGMEAPSDTAARTVPSPAGPHGDPRSAAPPAAIGWRDRGAAARLPGVLPWQHAHAPRGQGGADGGRRWPDPGGREPEHSKLCGADADRGGARGARGVGQRPWPRTQHRHTALAHRRDRQRHGDCADRDLMDARLCTMCPGR